MHTKQEPRAWRQPILHEICSIWPSIVPDYRLQARIHTGFHRFTEIGQNFQNKINRYVYIFNKSKLQVESRQDPKTVPTTASATLKEINHTMYPNITECLRIFSTLPVTTCECERNVSALRLLIRYLRSKI